MKLYLHYLIWFFAFFNGIIRLLGINPAFVRVGLPFSIIVLFVFSLRKKFKYPFLIHMLMFVLLSILSGYLNNMSLFQITDFITYTVFPYIYFLIVYNTENIQILSKMKKLIIFLFLLQLPAMIVKLILVGQAEDYIGTISSNAGSLSTVIPMVATSYLFSKFLFLGERKYLFMIFLFVLFGLSSEKRAILIFIPLIMFLILLLYFYANKINMTKVVRYIILSITVSFLLIYLIVRLNPSLTPEGKVGGSFDLEYVITYVKEYNTSSPYSITEMSRLGGLSYFTAGILESDFRRFLFGDGAGYLSVTEYNPMLAYYNVRYAGRMGFIWVLLQVGMLGAVLYFSIFIRMFNKIFRRIKRENSYDNIAFLGILIAVLIDLIFYSSSSIKYFSVMGVLFTYFGLIIRDKNFKTILRK